MGAGGSNVALVLKYTSEELKVLANAYALQLKLNAKRNCGNDGESCVTLTFLLVQCCCPPPRTTFLRHKCQHNQGGPLTFSAEYIYQSNNCV